MAPSIILLISGKIATGKTYTAEALAERWRALGAVHASFGYELKEAAARDHGLDLERLLNDRVYKEKHRDLLICYAKASRALDPAVFVRACLQRSDKEGANILIISDFRLPEEHEQVIDFYSKCPDRPRVFTLRLSASDDVRRQRGWTEKWNVDTDSTECALDMFKFDCYHENN